MEMDDNTRYALDILDAKHESQITRLWIALAITGLLFVVTNFFWIYREFQYEDVVVTATETVSQDSGEGGSNVVGDYNFYGKGYGETDDNENNNGKDTP